MSSLLDRVKHLQKELGNSDYHAHNVPLLNEVIEFIEKHQEKPKKTGFMGMKKSDFGI